MNNYDQNITIEIMEGGYILHYIEESPLASPLMINNRKIFTDKTALLEKVTQLLGRE